MTDSERFALNVVRLDKARTKIHSILKSTGAERDTCKANKDFDNYEVLARVDAHLHTALSGIEMACAESFNLKTDEIQPRTGGGGK